MVRATRKAGEDREPQWLRDSSRPVRGVVMRVLERKHRVEKLKEQQPCDNKGLRGERKST